MMRAADLGLLCSLLACLLASPASAQTTSRSRHALSATGISDPRLAVAVSPVEGWEGGEPVQVQDRAADLSGAQRVGLQLGGLAGLVVGGVVGWSSAQDAECIEQHFACAASAPLVGVIHAFRGALIGGALGGGAGLVVGTIVDATGQDEVLVVGIRVSAPR